MSICLEDGDFTLARNKRNLPPAGMAAKLIISIQVGYLFVYDFRILHCSYLPGMGPANPDEF